MGNEKAAFCFFFFVFFASMMCPDISFRLQHVCRVQEILNMVWHMLLDTLLW